MRIALATYADLPDWEQDDRPLHASLRARRIELVQPDWHDNVFNWSACDACLIRTTWDYQEHREQYLAWAARVASQTMLFNPVEIVRWNTHKSYLRDLEARGAPVVETAWLDAGTAADVRAILRERGWERGFIKPAIGATARETMRFVADDNGIAAAQQHVDRLLPREDLLLQPYLDTVETFGECSAVFIDGAISHTVRKIPVTGDYRVQDDFGASDELYEFTPEERRTAQRIYDSLERELLYGRADFLRHPDGTLRLTELELVEPSLFFRHCAGAADRLADALLARIGTAARSAAANR